MNSLKSPLFFLLLIIGLSLSCKNGSEHLEIGLNEIIYHDNFEYLVTDFKVLSVDEYTKRYRVKFKVINNDKVLKHTWKNSIAYLVDSKGNIYNNNKKLSVPESFLLRFFNKTDHKPHCLHILVKIQRQATS